MVHVFDRQRRLTGILQNAYKPVEQKRINAVSHFHFSLPASDTKNELCKPRHYIRLGLHGDLYRILPTERVVDEKGGFRYSCEHVIAQLIDLVMFGYHVVGNIGFFTAMVIEWLLDKQNKTYTHETGWVLDPSKEVNWVLGDCDFARQFEYGWEQETVLRALFTVANPISDPYMWVFDTSRYPYVLHLKRLDVDQIPQMYIRGGRNLLQLTHKSDPTSMCTRLFPLGEGEGVNQLNISSINNNVPFLESPQHIIDEYGIIERIWIDRRYTVQESLLDAGQTMLDHLQVPHEEYAVDFAVLGRGQWDTAEIGKVVEVVDFTKTYIVGIDYNHEEIIESRLHIANKPRNVAGTVAEMMDRQRIEMSYAQGATTFFERDAQGNCDPTLPLAMRMFIPSNLQIINFVLLDVEVSRFRKPFRVVGGAGVVTGTTGTTQDRIETTHVPSQVQRAWDTTTGPNPTVTAAPSAGAQHVHGLNMHTHNLEVTVLHRHSVDIRAHNHSLTMPEHEHRLDPGMAFAGNATSFDLIIDGIHRLTVPERTLSRDIAEFMVNAQNVIPRGRHFRIEIRPNDVAYCIMTVSVQSFTRSRGDRTM